MNTRTWTQKYIDPNNKRQFNMYIHFGDTNFDAIQHPPKQSYGVIFNEKKEIVLVAGQDNNCILPGGSIEQGETPHEALVREVYEESAVVVDENTIEPFFYQIVYEVVGEKEVFDSLQLRFIAKAMRVDPFKGDPGGGIIQQKWVPISELHKHLQWGKASETMQQLLLQRYGSTN